MEYSVPVSLGHLGVDVVAGVTELRDLFGKQLYALSRVAENYRLVYLQKQKRKKIPFNLEARRK